MNINLTHIDGLKIDLFRPYAKKCAVNIDTTQVKIQTSGKNNPDNDSVTQEHLDNVVKAVAEATRLNLELNNLKCKVEVIK